MVKAKPSLGLDYGFETSEKVTLSAAKGLKKRVEMLRFAQHDGLFQRFRFICSGEKRPWVNTPRWPSPFDANALYAVWKKDATTQQPSVTDPSRSGDLSG
jgi:hypothetical protein